MSLLWWSSPILGIGFQLNASSGISYQCAEGRFKEPDVDARALLILCVPLVRPVLMDSSRWSGGAPLFLELCLIGFSIGDPFLPAWLELLLVAAVGIAPILWMQWQKPFYIFSLIAVALKPEQLTEDQRRLLTLFKSQRNRLLAVLVPIVLAFALSKIYGVAPIATAVIQFPIEWRGAGLLLAAIAFLGSNLFAQVPASVLSVMLTGEPTFASTSPYPEKLIGQDFSLLGLKINQILPPMVPDDKLASVVAPSIASIETAFDETAFDKTASDEPVSDKERSPSASAESEPSETVESIESITESSQTTTPVSNPPAAFEAVIVEPSEPSSQPDEESIPSEKSGNPEDDVWSG